jgi:hypothetical protein
VRVYLPTTLPLLRAWAAAREIPPSTGYAVTPGLRAELTGADDELEAAAMLRAARASLRILDGQPRRAVLAVDTEPAVRDDLDEGAVRTAALPWQAVAAGMVDGPDAEAAVRAAAAVIDEADLGDEDAELAVGDAEDHELLWYATQELADL